MIVNIINIVISVAGLLVLVYGFIKMHRELELSEVTPTKCHIIEYYGKDKRTMVKDYTQAYYVTVTNGKNIYYCVKLREPLAQHQNELLVHFKDGRLLAYKEYKSYSSREETLGMLHNFKSRTFLLEVAVLWFVCLFATNIYCRCHPAIEGCEYDTAVLNESAEASIDKIFNKEKPVPASAMFSIADEVIRMWEVREPDNIRDYQLNFIIADARYTFATGEDTNHETPKTGLPIRDLLYNNIHDYMIEQASIIHDAFFIGDQGSRVDDLHEKYTLTLYVVYFYHALGYAITIFATLMIMYKIAMNCLYYHTLKKYQEYLGV